MYVRTIKRKNKDGSTVEYIQLAHNEWNKQKGFAQAKVIYSFGRRDQLDVEALRRLVKSLNRFLDPEDVIRQEHSGEQLRFEKSRQAGGAYLLKALWNRLGIDACLKKAADGRAFSAPIPEAVFAMVANRALAPSSKLAIEDWVQDHVYLGNSEKLQVQHFYRAMDFLLEHEGEIQKKVFWATATLLNLTVDLIFFDTINTYFEIDDPGDSKIKAYGHSKHKRDDLPQVTIGLAVTREGMPVRCWVLPGNQNDAKSVKKVQEELRGWNLGRIYWVMDRGMTSQENKRILQRAGGQYILGEKLSGNNTNEAVLSKPGRFRKVSDKDNLYVKEVVLDQKRYVIVYNPEQAKCDRMNREKILNHLEGQLNIANASGRSRAKCKTILHSSMGRYVKELKSGKLTIDRAKVKKDKKLDGKYLLSSSDHTLSPEDIALGYKQLLGVERAFRTLKSSLGLRPVYHSKDDRIKSHVLLCWLSLALIRMAEITTGQTWRSIRHHLQQLHLIEFSDKKHRVLQHTELTHNQLNILKKLKIKPPKHIISIESVS